MQSRSSYEYPHLEYMADSAEQIAESIDRTGLWDQLCEAFQAAIARVNKSQQKSDRPTIDETRKGDSEGDAPLKYGKPWSL